MTDPIEDLWAQVPDAHCRGLCQDACGPVGASLTERERIWQRHGVALPDPFDGPIVHRCPLLGLDGRCTTYEDRPLSCRLYGAAEGLPCPHGCGPTFGRIPDAAARGLLHQALALDTNRLTHHHERTAPS